jgi:hypothetical protein
MPETPLSSFYIFFLAFALVKQVFEPNQTLVDY